MPDDARLPERELTVAEAFARLPLETPDRSAWPVLAARLASLGTMLSGVAHELNNPLAIVMGRASLLEGKAGEGELAADARRFANVLMRLGVQRGECGGDLVGVVPEIVDYRDARSGRADNVEPARKARERS